jgi:glucose-6-phosphate isomerase
MLHLPFELQSPQIRTTEEMRIVLLNPECQCKDPLYFMYRNVAKTQEDQSWLKEHNLRYDITVIPPALIGEEYVKTKGHYHPKNSYGIEYPELYEVLDGTGHYLLQKKDLTDVFVVLASSGDLVLVPPGYGHVTINPTSGRTLVMANLVADNFTSEYYEFEQQHGAAYYEVRNRGFIRNPKYPRTPMIRQVKVNPACIRALTGGKSLYDLVREERMGRILDPRISSDKIIHQWYQSSVHR